MIGATLAHYRITGELGTGGMGEVWRAEDQKLGREVALKLLPAEFGEDEQRLERFQREAKVLASLNHPNIAHLYGLETVPSCHPEHRDAALRHPLTEGQTHQEPVILSERVRERVEGSPPGARVAPSPNATPGDDGLAYPRGILRLRGRGGRSAQDDMELSHWERSEGSPEARCDVHRSPSSQSSGDPSTRSSDSSAQGDVGETTFLVMELVEGEDLSERIARGPIPVDEAISIALQIAEALEAAHEAGIVHRDLKPANVKLRTDGAVKVLDFGLAKAWESNAEDASLSLSPTLTQHATAAGVILGTAAYMSPEQARGQPVDRRADIWAFGVVLWEMLTGSKLFEGETVTDVLASVLKEAPDLDALPNDTPPALGRLVARCLHREPRERLQWIGDARLELSEAAAHRPAASDSAVPKARHAGTGREVLAWSLAVLAIAALLFLWLAPDDETGSGLTRFSVVLGDDKRLSLVDLPLLDLSPDGRMVVFAAADLDHGQDVLHLRRLEDENITVIDGTEGASNPFFSPNGSSIGFFVDGKLKKVDIGGGSIVTLADAETPRGAVWLPDGTILFSPEYSAGLMSIDSGGGVPREIVALDNEAGERTLRFPDVIPGGRAILFTVGMLDSPNNYDEARIDVYSPQSGERKTILERANMARWIDDRTLVYARAGVLYAVAFDPGRLETVGQPVPVIEDLGGDPSSGAAHVAAAPDGTLIWVTGAVTETDSMLTVVHRNGEETRLPLEPRGFNQPRFSPDGSRLAVTIGEAISGIDGDIWIYSFASETLSRLTFDGNGLYPVWFADGRSIGFLSYLVNPSVLVRAVDGRGGNEAFTKGDLSPIFPESISPDGSMLAYTKVGQSSDIFLVERGGEPRLFQERASGPVFSPDGRWIAYSSPGAGSSSIFVRPVEGEGMWQVSPGLGGYPRWSGDGRKLFYIDIGTAKRPLMEVDVEDDDAFRASAPRVAIPDLGGRFMTTTAPASNWDTAPDGDRFIFVEFERDERSRGKIEIALDWAGQLELDRE